MSKFWCDKHEKVVNEGGCVECIEEDMRERVEEAENTAPSKE